MKRTYIILSTLAVFMVSFYTTSLAQTDIKMFQVQDLKMESSKGNMLLSWETSLAEAGDFFLVEKLDKNWDYIKVGEVAVNKGQKYNQYKLADQQPVEGENYYRITLVKPSGEQLNSDLLIADYFSQPKNDDFKFLFNDKFATYANLKMLETTPSEIGMFGTQKYAYHTLKMRRLKSLSLLDLTDIDVKSMVATNNKKP